ncbi:MAG TPA: DUF2490 domain-containing protein [Lunatimonas sp.]|nr:DUF2490 domain-containing protein [Lunatimonas sp.]
MDKLLGIAYTCFLLLIIAFPASAQRTVNALENGGVYWTRYYVEFELSDKLKLDAEVDNRRFFSPARQFQTIVRSTLYYKKTNNFNFGAGLAYSQLYSIYTPIVQPEIRPHQEANFTHSHDKWNFNHRLRTEQRFRGDTVRTFLTPEEVDEQTIGTYSFDIRARYEFTTDFTIVEKNRQKGHWTIQLATEIMAHMDSDEFFDTYRFYGGFQYYLNERIRMELGYLKSTEKDYRYDTLFNYENLRFTFRHKL